MAWLIEEPSQISLTTIASQSKHIIWCHCEFYCHTIIQFTCIHVYYSEWKSDASLSRDGLLSVDLRRVKSYLPISCKRAFQVVSAWCNYYRLQNVRMPPLSVWWCHCTCVRWESIPAWFLHAMNMNTQMLKRELVLLRPIYTGACSAQGKQ